MATTRLAPFEYEYWQRRLREQAARRDEYLGEAKRARNADTIRSCRLNARKTNIYIIEIEKSFGFTGFSIDMVPMTVEELRPIKGVSAKSRWGKKYVEILIDGMPERITSSALHAATEILGSGSSGYLREETDETTQRQFLTMAILEVWKVYAPEKLIATTKQRAKRTKRGNALHYAEFKYQDDWDIYSGSHLLNEKKNMVLQWVSYTCPSTKQLYVSSVPTDITSADAAMAWKFGLKVDEYNKIEVET